MNKKLMALLIVAVLIVTISACGSVKKEGLSGSIQIVGSTSMEQLCALVAENYMEQNRGVKVFNEYIGSTAGIESLLAGTADIGTSSRNLTEEEKNNGAVENIVAKDGIVIIVNSDVTNVKELTTEQVRSIFMGKIANWNEIGGPDAPIITIGHEAGSGTRDPFEEILNIVGKCKYANELVGSGAVLARVTETKGAIGYCSLAVANENVTHIKLDGVEATKENIQDGKYKLNKMMIMATKGSINEQKEEVQNFFEFIYSDKGEELITKVNLIPIHKVN